MNVNEYISSGLIEAVILGVADATEVTQYHQMRLTHPEVLNYANTFEQSLEDQYLQNATLEPSAGLFDKIKAQTQTEAPVIPISNRVTQAQIDKNRKTWKQYAIAASVAILLGSLAVNFMLSTRVKALAAENKDLSAANIKITNDYAFLKEASMRPITMDGAGMGVQAAAKSTFYWNQEKNVGHMIVQNLPATPANKDYQLWAIVDGKPVSLGVMRMENGKIVIEIKNVPAKATQFAVTLEKEGGMPQPNLEQLYLSGKIST